MADIKKIPEQDAGIGYTWDNSNSEGRAYVPSMFRRSKVVDPYVDWRTSLLHTLGAQRGEPYVTSQSLDVARDMQASETAKAHYPAESVPYNTLKDAYMRFGAENQDYYKNNGVIPPANMKRNWTPEEQRLLDHMTPKDREKAETEANNIVKNTSQPANYKHASFGASLKDHFTKRANGNLPYQKTAAEKHAFIQGLLQKHAGCSSSRGRKQTVRKCNTQGQCKSAAQILWDSLTRKN